jgi:hypothetical protein
MFQSRALYNSKLSKINRILKGEGNQISRVSCYYLFTTACNEGNEESGAVIAKRAKKYIPNAANGCDSECIKTIKTIITFCIFDLV